MMTPLTFGSLFAGIGGLDLGMERAGMVCKWQVEIDDYATRVLERHWPNVRRWRDVTTFPPDTVRAECESGARRRGVRQGNSQPSTWKVDLICGGFPCQDISYAGKGAGLDGARSGLFYEVARIVRILEPRYVLLENVAALLTRGLDAVLGTLASLGYDAEWHCVPAAAVGAPHIRDRVFIVAYTSGLGWNPRWSEREGQFGSAALVCPGDVSDANRREQGRGQQSERETNQRNSDTAGDGEERCMANPSIPRLEIGQYQERLRQFAATVGSGQWATEPDVDRVAHGVPSRVDRLRCLGNAVVPQVAEYVGRMIMQHHAAE